MHNLFRGNRKILALFVIIILLFLAIGIFLVFRKNTSVTAITPVSYTPALEAVKVNPFAKIGVVFSRPATPEDEKDISLSISPVSYNSVVWSSDKKSVYFTTDNPLELSTQYNVTLTFFGRKFAWSFTTASGSELSQQDQEKIQGIYDSQYAKAEQAFIDKYPWFSKLPPENNDCLILFDSSINTFYIYVYPKVNSVVPQSAQIPGLENEATQELKNIGVDLSLYKITWSINPQ